MEPHAEVGELRLHPVGYPVLVFHIVAGQPVLRSVDGILLCSLCENGYSEVLRARRRRGVVALVSPVTHLHVGRHFRLEGRFLGYNVDGSCHSAAPIERRAGTLDDFKSVDIVCTQLLQAVHACQSRIDRLAIDEHLRVLGTQALHAHQ